jgi:hypothetical protein
MREHVLICTAAILGSLNPNFAADVPPVSISFVSYTNDVSWLRAVRCVGFQVPDNLSAKYYNRDAELQQALKADPEYKRFVEMFPVEKYAIFKLANTGQEYLSWTVGRITAWPTNGPAPYKVTAGSCETNENLRLGFYGIEPAAERYLAVQAPSACTNWNCDFVFFSKNQPSPTRVLGPTVSR